MCIRVLKSEKERDIRGLWLREREIRIKGLRERERLGVRNLDREIYLGV